MLNVVELEPPIRYPSSNVILVFGCFSPVIIVVVLCSGSSTLVMCVVVVVLDVSAVKVWELSRRPAGASESS